MKRKYHNFIIKKKLTKKNLRILMLKNFYLKRTKELFAKHCRLGKITFKSHKFFLILSLKITLKLLNPILCLAKILN
jgi:hypothetical protein